MKENVKYILMFVVAVTIAGGLRFVSDIPNFSPMLAIALFSGIWFSDKKLAFGIPLLAQFGTDLYFGLHESMWAVYLSFALITFIGLKYNQNSTLLKNIISITIGSIIFFILTNFSVWALTSFYPKSISGIIECYSLAIPFFRNTLLSGLIFTPILFGLNALFGAKELNIEDTQKVKI
jgi:Family of unknown function (DUF6580)